MKNANLVEQICQCLPGAVRFCHRKQMGSRVLGQSVAVCFDRILHALLRAATRHAHPFYKPRARFPHNDVLAKLAELGDAFSFTQIFFSIRENNLSPALPPKPL